MCGFGVYGYENHSRNSAPSAFIPISSAAQSHFQINLKGLVEI